MNILKWIKQLFAFKPHAASPCPAKGFIITDAQCLVHTDERIPS